MTESFRRICVLGTGSFGSAIANYIAGNHAEDSPLVTLYGRDTKTVDSINRLHINPKYLPGLTLEHNLTATTNIEEALAGSDLVVLGVPSQSIRELVLEARTSIPRDAAILNLAKGMEVGIHLRMSQVVEDTLAGRPLPFATLTGPSFAQEIAAGSPVGITVGSRDKKLLSRLHSLLNSPGFDVKITTDLAGVEIGGALKNIFAVVAGVFAGCDLGSSIVGDFFTRAMVEMRDVGMYSGGKWSTFSGRSGLGDLAVTCKEPSRNFRFGRTYARLFAEAKPVDTAQAYGDLHVRVFEETISELGTRTVEGYDAIQPIHAIVTQRRMFAPIIQSVHDLFYAKRFSPNELLPSIRLLDRKRKWDGTSVFSIVMHELFPKLWYRRGR